MQPIQMTFIGKRAEHPPLSTLMFDVKLHNEADQPRWFLLPAKLGASPQPIDSSAYAVEVDALAGAGKVLVGRFLGAPGFQAVHLPAGGQVTIRGLGIKLVGALPADPLVLQVVTGEALSVGGEPAEAWFQQSPTTDAHADVQQAAATMVSGREAPELKAVPVSVTDARRMTITVPVSAGVP